MPLEMMQEAHKIWENIKLDGSVEDLHLEIELQKTLMNFFHVGPYYYYIFDVINGRFNYVSPQIEDVLGYIAEEMTIEYFLSRVHPDDQPQMLNYEKAVVNFFQQLPGDKISKYKFSYDYRVKSAQDVYIRILQQVITVQYDKTNGVLLTLGVHTDISHIKRDNSSSLSFIGLEGEPSYIGVDVLKAYKPKKKLTDHKGKANSESSDEWRAYGFYSKSTLFECPYGKDPS